MNRSADLDMIEMCKFYILETEGPEAASKFFVDLERFGRVGQALMSNISVSDYLTLSGSLYDPFHRDSMVLAALDFLTR